MAQLNLTLVRPIQAAAGSRNAFWAISLSAGGSQRLISEAITTSVMIRVSSPLTGVSLGEATVLVLGRQPIA